jgi:phosphoglucosamine mutase
VLAVIAGENRKASEAAHLFEPLPQLLHNVRFRRGTPLEEPRVTERIRAAEARLNGSGRLLVRKSGTEPVIRIMAESDDIALVQEVVRDVASAIEDVAN